MSNEGGGAYSSVELTAPAGRVVASPLSHPKGFQVPDLSETLLTEADLAARWRTARGSLANDRSAGRGPTYLKLGRRVPYRLADIEAYEDAACVSGAAA